MKKSFKTLQIFSCIIFKVLVRETPIHVDIHKIDGLSPAYISTADFRRKGGSLLDEIVR